MAPNHSLDVLYLCFCLSFVTSLIAYELVAKGIKTDESLLNKLIHHGVATALAILLIVSVKIWIMKRRLEPCDYNKINLICGYSGVLLINLFFHFYVWWIGYEIKMLFIVISIYHALLLTHSALFIIDPALKYKYNYSAGELAFTYLCLFLFPVFATSVFGFSRSTLTHSWFNFSFSFFVTELAVVLRGRYSSQEELPFYEDEKHREAIEEYEFRRNFIREVASKMGDRKEAALLILQRELLETLPVHRLLNLNETGERQMVTPH